MKLEQPRERNSVFLTGFNPDLTGDGLKRDHFAVHFNFFRAEGKMLGKRKYRVLAFVV